MVLVVLVLVLLAQLLQSDCAAARALGSSSDDAWLHYEQEATGLSALSRGFHALESVLVILPGFKPLDGSAGKGGGGAAALEARRCGLLLDSARRELQRGLGIMLGRPIQAHYWVVERPLGLSDFEQGGELKDMTVVLCRSCECPFLGAAGGAGGGGGDGFGNSSAARCGAGDDFEMHRVYCSGLRRSKPLFVVSPSCRGLLYGAFAVLREAQQRHRLPRAGAALRSTPSSVLRIVEHWDNLDGSVERGYAGSSIFDWARLDVSLLGRLVVAGAWKQPPYTSRGCYPIRFETEFERCEAVARIYAYARLLASVGVNGVVLNNCNFRPSRGGQNWRILSDEFVTRKLPVLASIFSMRFGVKLFISVPFDAPSRIGGLPSASPGWTAAEQWWRARVQLLYSVMSLEEFGGFLVKPDSEGEVGPARLGASHVEGANMLALALRDFYLREVRARSHVGATIEHSRTSDGAAIHRSTQWPAGGEDACWDGSYVGAQEDDMGLVLWRTFVYAYSGCAADRARHAGDYFIPLDGMFEKNVVLVTKSGPIDFQVREPPSPLLGRLPETSQCVELQITQEYTGQATHLVFLLPQWLEIVSSVLTRSPTVRTVLDVVAQQHGSDRGALRSGMVGISNVGSDSNWGGHDFALANLYAFGRLAWGGRVSARRVAEEWVIGTFGAPTTNDACTSASTSARERGGRATGCEEVDTIVDMMMDSWEIYEAYTSPLGLGFLCEKGEHFDPAASIRRSYHRSNGTHIGVDRGLGVDGTGFVSQYDRSVREELLRLDSPLLLFFHRVGYADEVVGKLDVEALELDGGLEGAAGALKVDGGLEGAAGVKLIQRLYDSYFYGVARVRSNLIERWESDSVSAYVDPTRHQRVSSRLRRQYSHAVLWRNAMVCFLLDESGVPDGRAALRGNWANLRLSVRRRGVQMSADLRLAMPSWVFEEDCASLCVPVDLEGDECSVGEDVRQFAGALVIAAGIFTTLCVAMLWLRP